MYRALKAARRMTPAPIRALIKQVLPQSVRQAFNRLPGRPGFLKHQLSQLGDNITFVQVGCHDGHDDPVRQLAMERIGWKGVLVEAVPYIFQRLSKNYSDPRFKLVNMAVASQSGTVEFYHVAEEAGVKLKLPEWFDQIGSLDRAHIVKHLGPSIEPYIRALMVPCDSLTRILEMQGVSTVDYLQIDTEGYDFEILKQLDFDRFAPRLILYEHRNLSERDQQAATSLLSSKGYETTVDGYDTLATRR
jgi:FkbM family methyltransferase